MFLLKYTYVFVVTQCVRFCKNLTFWDRPFKTFAINQCTNKGSNW